MQMTRWKSTKMKSNVDHLRLVEGPTIEGHIVQHSDVYHLLIIDGAVIRCTPTEYRLLMRLLQQSEYQLSFEILEQCAYQYSVNHRTHSALIRHMRRVRPKLWPFGLDILSITGYGYMLHAVPLEHPVLEQETGH